MLLGDLEHLDLRFSYYYLGVPILVLQLSLRIPEGSRNRETPRKNSYWAYYVVNFFPFFGFLPILSTSTISSSCSLIDRPTSSNDPLVLIHVRWLMILAQGQWLLPSIHWDDCSAIPNISHVANISHNEDHYSTRPWPLNYSEIPMLISPLAHLQKGFFGFSEPFQNCFLGIPRERVFLDHKVVEVVPQELRTHVAPMPIINPKEGALGPVFILAVLWLHNV